MLMIIIAKKLLGTIQNEPIDYRLYLFDKEDKQIKPRYKKTRKRIIKILVSIYNLEKESIKNTSQITSNTNKGKTKS